MIKIIKIVLGTICFILGSIGIVLPILPTTPLYILAAFFYATSSDRLHNKLVNSEMYKKHISDITDDKAVTKAKKIKILCMITIVLGLSIYFTPVVYGRIIIGLVLLGHYYFFLFKIKTINNKPM